MKEKIMKKHVYREFRDLEAFIPTNPGRHMLQTRGGILCKYFSTKRLVQGKKKGYTPYLYKYDLKPDGNLIRVGIRMPRFEHNGTVYSEELDVFPSNFSPALIRQLHIDYIDPSFNAELFKHKYPLSNKPSEDAYKILTQYGKEYGFLPEYPSKYNHLWFIQTSYKNTKLTFCYYFSSDEPILFDIFVGENYNRLARELRDARDYTQHRLYICLNACTELYDAFYKEFPTATYIFDATVLPQFFDHAAEYMPARKRSFQYEVRNEIISDLDELFRMETSKQKNYTLFETRETCTDNIQAIYNAMKTRDVFPKGPEKYEAFFNQFITKFEYILNKNPNFILNYKEQSTFHSFLSYDTVDYYQKNLALTHGYTPKRTAYVMLAHLKARTPKPNPPHIYQKKNECSMTYAPYYTTLLKNSH